MYDNVSDFITDMHMWLVSDTDPITEPSRIAYRFVVPNFDIIDPAHDAAHFIRMKLEEARRDIAGQIAKRMGERVHAVRFEYRFPRAVDDFDQTTKIIITATIWPDGYCSGAEQNIVTVYLRGEKRRCRWCSGQTYDDTRGNCLACGGPRGELP